MRSHDAPVDFLVVEFPEGARDFPYEVARELASLVDAEMIRVLDVVILDKDPDGTVSMLEPDELGVRDTLRRVEADLRAVLPTQDIDVIAELLPLGRSAGIVVWEQVWAAPLAQTALDAGGAVLGHGRITHGTAPLARDHDDTRRPTARTT